MKIIVQKFGGTSVRDANGRERASYHIQSALEDGYKVVVVVSAMGRKGEPYATDTLLSLIDNNRHVSKREVDLLMSCGEVISSIVFSNMLNEKGIKATSLTGAQAGFLTNSDFTNAKIIEMKCDRLKEELKDHDVVVVTGFQGADEKGDTTTLGRGGSDTSASALGAAIDAEFVDIFTDVEGVMTADPRIVENARPLSIVTYLDSEGTLVTSHGEAHQKGSDVKERLVTGIAHVSDVTQIKVLSKEGNYNLQSEVFRAMAQESISVDFINISPRGVAYTVPDEMTDKAVSVLQALGYDPSITKNCAKISTVGAGIAGVPGVTAKIVGALSDKGIQILQSADSHTTIWVLVKQDDLKEAVNALHEAFELSKSNPQERSQGVKP
jgi:aspartate kinase